MMPAPVPALMRRVWAGVRGLRETWPAATDTAILDRSGGRLTDSIEFELCRAGLVQPGSTPLAARRQDGTF